MSREIGSWRQTPLLLLPILLLWRFVTFVVNHTGIPIAQTLGLVLMILGVTLTCADIGIVFGLPLFL